MASDHTVCKASLREIALAKRARVAAAQRHQAARALYPALQRIGLPPAADIAAYWPIRNEFDPRPAIDRLRADGHRIALPVVSGPDGLEFRLWNPQDDLEPAVFGIRVPPVRAGRIDPDVLLMPLAAFDRRGGRIGYGAGYYDRAIERIEARNTTLRIGLAFAVQEVDRVPIEPHDQLLHFVVTEAETVACATAGPHP